MLIHWIPIQRLPFTFVFKAALEKKLPLKRMLSIQTSD